jgi:predicted DNA-binding ArsR family transcriptional regulator
MRFRRKSVTTEVDAEARTTLGAELLDYILHNWNKFPVLPIPHKFQRLLKLSLREKGLRPLVLKEMNTLRDIHIVADITDTEGKTEKIFIAVTQELPEEYTQPTTRKWRKKTTNGTYEVVAKIGTIGERVLKEFRKSWGYVKANEVEQVLPKKLADAITTAGLDKEEVPEGAGELWVIVKTQNTEYRVDFALTVAKEDPIIFAP